MPLTVGSRLGHYDVTALIGAGGMGQVYQATDTRLDRTVAIKVLPEHVAADPDLKQRFEREARTVAALNHPHICTLFDIWSQDRLFPGFRMCIYSRNWVSNENWGLTALALLGGWRVCSGARFRHSALMVFKSQSSRQ